MFFQDLSQEVKDQIVNGILKQLQKTRKYKIDSEYVLQYINCRNTEAQVWQWTKKYGEKLVNPNTVVSA